MNDTQLIFGLANFHMWATLVVILMAILLFTLDKIAIELTAIGIVIVLLLLFHYFPFFDANGVNALSAADLLKGFSNPILFAILALLIIGQGLFHTGAVERPIQIFATIGRFGKTLAFAATLLTAGIISAFLNNTPVVVIFIPIISAIAAKLHFSQSRALMPLSFICILGGMITLIGSSANLIVATLAVESGANPIGFFDFFVPGALLASLGAVYVIFILPHLIEPRATMAQTLTEESGKQFLAQIAITEDHPWIGMSSAAGLFPKLKDMTVRMVQRGEHAFLPPFEDVTLSSGDVVILAATRKVLTEALTDRRSVLTVTREEPQDSGGDLDSAVEEVVQGKQLTMAETVIAPGSRLIGGSIEQASLRATSGCIVLAIQRRSRMVRTALDRIRLEAGDVLLVLGDRKAIRALRSNRDLLLLEWSASDLPVTHHANRALFIFTATILAAASGLVPIAIAALMGALTMIFTGCLNIRQAVRAIDVKIYLLIGTAFALAEPLRVTGGAQFVAHIVVDSFASYGPHVLLSAFFLLTAVLTNFLSNHAAAALLAPIAVSTAREVGVAPEPFIYGLIFALNCSFATPIAYQTNLIVMGPGHYRFRDFLKGGIPLILLLWLAYSIFAPFYYDL